MKRTQLLFLLLMLIPLASCQPEQEVPMWEGVKKSEKMLEADKEFIAATEETIGLKAGAQRSLQAGWKFLLEENDPETAIRRFNQAWLLDPSNPNIYWGFAVATHRQGRPIAVIYRHFSKAENGFRTNKKALADLYSDFGRVLGERGKFDLAREKFEKAIAMDPKHKNANLSMASMLEAQGKKTEARKYWEAAK